MAVKRVIVTYHCVLAIIQATAPIVRKSAAARTRTPARKGLEAILLHAPVKRRACESERLGGAADIPAMCLEGAQDRFLSTASSVEVSTPRAAGTASAADWPSADCPAAESEKSPGSSIVSSLSMTARSTAWRKARTLPGHPCAVRRSRAAALKRFGGTLYFSE